MENTENKKSSVAKILGISLLALAGISLVLVILLNFMPVVSVMVEGNSEYDPARLFVGWEVTYYSYGGTGQIIYGRYAYSANVLMILATLLPVFALLICTLKARSASKKGKAVASAVYGFILAAVLAFGAIILFNALAVTEMTASTATTSTAPLVPYIEMAKEAGTYNIGAFPIITAVVFVITALVSIAKSVLSIMNFGGKD